MTPRMEVLTLEPDDVIAASPTGKNSLYNETEWDWDF